MPLLAQSGHADHATRCPLLTQSGHEPHRFPAPWSVEEQPLRRRVGRDLLATERPLAACTLSATKQHHAGTRRPFDDICPPRFSIVVEPESCKLLRSESAQNLSQINVAPALFAFL